MNNIEKIRQEIEQLMCETNDTQFEIGKRYMCRTILDFIDTLLEEKPSEDLEKAAEESLEGQGVAELFCGSYEAWQMLEMFKSGVEWQKKQILKNSEEDALLLERAWLTLDHLGYEELAERLKTFKEKYANKM